MIAFSICVFPILLTTVRGLREVEPDLLDLVRTLRDRAGRCSPRSSCPARCRTSSRA
jgi:ABC-type nitrate/sulfonate/bicarbonate transport system permease component